MHVRPATHADRPAIRAIHEAAFNGALEADIADALHAAADERISLVATDGDAGVIGHIVLSAGRLGEHEVLCLGPIGVAPERQREGIGAQLMRAALTAAAETSAPLVLLVRHPAYYPRFGFEPAAPLGLTSQWDAGDAWMAYRLPAYDPGVRGHVAFPPAFG